jgi:excisionase family DNA binding protein
MDEWQSVAQAAAMLKVGPRQVRHLVESGVLPAQKIGNSWLVQTAAVRARAAHTPSAGRPLSPAMAWVVLSVVQRLLMASTDAGVDVWGPIADRKVRHRVRQLLAEPVPARQWEKWLARRAERRRIWVHPGVLAQLVLDRRLHPGGTIAAAAHGIGLASSSGQRFYIYSAAVDAFIADYRASYDSSGQVELMIVAAESSHAVLGDEGTVPESVALADLLESDDARERHLAADRLAIVAPVGRV